MIFWRTSTEFVCSKPVWELKGGVQEDVQPLNSCIVRWIFTGKQNPNISWIVPDSPSIKHKSFQVQEAVDRRGFGPQLACNVICEYCSDFIQKKILFSSINHE